MHDEKEVTHDDSIEVHEETEDVTVIMDLDTLASRCGYFFNSCLTKGYENKPKVNNGYNCSHPEQEEQEEGLGWCLAVSCPLCYSADGVVCARCGIVCESCGDENCECYDNMVVVRIPRSEFDVRYMWLVPDDEQ